MNRLIKIVAAAAIALPVAAFAQSSPSVKPADQPRSALEQEQTTKNGQATNYPGPATDTSSTTSTDGSMAKHKGMKHDAMKNKAATTDTTKPGDVPTYPAPAKDGTPTK